jgi:hypothetical protein
VIVLPFIILTYHVSARTCVEDYWQYVSINQQNYTLHCNGQDLVPDNVSLSVGDQSS